MEPCLKRMNVRILAIYAVYLNVDILWSSAAATAVQL